MTRIIIAAAIVGSVGLMAQTPQPPLEFDVISVKPNMSGERGGSSRADPGRYVGVNVTLRRIIGLAYRPVQEFVGGPSWINTDGFDIEAKADFTPNREQMLEMLRSLLADRFKLVVHRETRQMPVYALVLARADGKTGPQLRRAEPCAQDTRCGGFSVGNGVLKGAGVTLTQLAAELPSATEGRYVIDRSGLTGLFDVNLRWNVDALGPGIIPGPIPDPIPGPDAPSVFAAIQEQLGLKLEPIIAPIDVIVIDRAERPTSN
jgi:uncharacterized protein (TIGR03435 family)